MTLLEKIVSYSQCNPFPLGLKLERIEVGEEVMKRLSAEVKDLTGVSLGEYPERIIYRGVSIVLDSNTGTQRVDAVWSDKYLTQSGGALA